MANDMPRLLKGLTCRAGATAGAIAKGEEHLGVKLPSDYVEFLKLADGGEGFISKDAYLAVWGIEELPSMNQSYEVQRYAPGLLLFGSDGGGEAYAFDTRDPRWRIVQVPFVGMNHKSARYIATTFSAFLESLSQA